LKSAQYILQNSITSDWKYFYEIESFKLHSQKIFMEVFFPTGIVKKKDE